MNLNISVLRDFLQNCHFALIISILLLLASDIEQNPGPPNFLSDLSVLHLNIRSIRNKMEYIIDNFLDFDILCVSETHLDSQNLSYYQTHLIYPTERTEQTVVVDY